jgi:3-methyladenine DNA glycosylase AlkC
MAEPITDGMLGAAQVAALADRLEAVLGAGNNMRAIRAVGGRLDGVTLTGRVGLLRDALLAELPPDWPAFARVVQRALDDERFSGWIIWPVGDAVAARALDDADPRAFDQGLDLLAVLTPRLTSEFSLRPFLAADLERTLRAARRWAENPDQHVRRLASEGTRPRLPWAPRVRALLDLPEATISILDALYRDPCDRVRRSVANHLGDLAKDDPELAVTTAARWLEAPDRSTAWVVRHGLRALVKTGHPGALALQGFDPPDQIAVSGPHLATRVVRIGERLEFAVEVGNRGTTPAQLMVDYLVHYRTARGGTAPKVFKLATRALQPGETTKLEDARSFAARSTRRLHPGPHALELQVNGRRFGKTAFDLIDPERD